MSTPTTDAGRRLLWMVATEPIRDKSGGPSGRRWPVRVDARLVERIAEEFVPRIEEEAVANFCRSEYLESIIAGVFAKEAEFVLGEGDRPLPVKRLTAQLVAAFREDVA